MAVQYKQDQIVIYKFLVVSFEGASLRFGRISWSAVHLLQQVMGVRGRSASSDVSSDISLSPLYIPPHRR